MELFGTSYLGLQNDPEYLQILTDALLVHGSNNPISRLNDYDFSPLEAAEVEIAREWCCEDACLLSSGYLAGAAVMQVLQKLAKERSWCVVLASNHHPCTHPTSDRKPEHLNDSDAANALNTAVSQGKIDGWIMVSDSVDIMTGLPAGFTVSGSVASHASLCALDVSHSAYIWSHEHLNRRAQIDQNLVVYFGSLGKAPAFPAGFVAGPSDIVNLVRALPSYFAASPPPLANAVAFLTAKHLRARKRERLEALMNHVNSTYKICRSADFSFPIYNYGTGLNSEYLTLHDEGFVLSYLAYPDPEGNRVLRSVLNADIVFKDLDRFLEMSTTLGLVPAKRSNRVPAWKIVW